MRLFYKPSAGLPPHLLCASTLTLCVKRDGLVGKTAEGWRGMHISHLSPIMILKMA